jgi:hypothetical protein
MGDYGEYSCGFEQGNIGGFCKYRNEPSQRSEEIY